MLIFFLQRLNKLASLAVGFYTVLLTVQAGSAVLHWEVQFPFTWVFIIGCLCSSQRPHWSYPKWHFFGQVSHVSQYLKHPQLLQHKPVPWQRATTFPGLCVGEGIILQDLIQTRLAYFRQNPFFPPFLSIQK